MPIIETARLQLRPFTLDDISELDKVFSDADVMKFSSAGVMSREAIEAFIHDMLKSYQENGFGLWALIERRSGKLIGCCGLNPSDIENAIKVDPAHEQACIEIGYRLAKAYWGQGLASEAAKATLDYAFNNLQLKRIIAIIAKQHSASINVAKKVGMKKVNSAEYKSWAVDIYQCCNEK